MKKAICNHCWGVYEARRESAKYCSAACRQRAHRVKNGQPDKRMLTEFDVDERIVCKHCHTGFYWKGKGRKPRFCSNSCRVMNNRKLQDACVQFVYAMNNPVFGWTQYDCREHVRHAGTGKIVEWATESGWIFSETSYRFWKRSIDMFAKTNE